MWFTIGSAFHFRKKNIGLTLDKLPSSKCLILECIVVFTFSEGELLGSSDGIQTIGSYFRFCSEFTFHSNVVMLFSRTCATDTFWVNSCCEAILAKNAFSAVAFRRFHWIPTTEIPCPREASMHMSTVLKYLFLLPCFVAGEAWIAFRFPYTYILVVPICM